MMKIMFIECIDKRNNEENELLRVITGDVFSTNDELKAMVTIDMADIKEQVLYDTEIELIMHGIFLGKLISIPLSVVDGSESTELTHTCYIEADTIEFDKGFKDISDRYDAQFALMEIAN